jgi:Kdo2-lipid IVA lauroyltransferase/acyltransferase
MTRVGLSLLWLLHWLPLPALAALGRGLGTLAYPLARERRQVALTNLRLCFPEMAEVERESLARRHLQLVMRSMLERSLCWWASAPRMRRLVRIDGLERLRALEHRPLILLVPHFVGLDMCATRLALEINAASVYSKQKDPVIDRLLYHGRTRFGDQFILSRQEGMRPIVKALRAGRPLYYLPDMDYGPRDALFVAFFGVPAATIPGVSRLARLTGAAVLPCIARMGPKDYVLEIREAWADFPGADLEADTRRMNAYIEDCVREAPEQYYWVHKRFKTRPPGEPRIY